MELKRLIESEEKYPKVSSSRFFNEILTESDARELIWKMKYGSSGFCCRSCDGKTFWELKSNPEIRECRSCNKQVRLRSGTMFEHSKLALLIWVRAIYFIMQDKRGISALSLKRLLGMNSYGTTWTMLQKIRKALGERDSGYKLKQVVELDGAYFVNDERIKTHEKPYVHNKKLPVLVAVERKDWIDENGKKKSKAGFAKIMIDPFGNETAQGIKKFVSQNIKLKATIRTDGKKSFNQLKENYNHEGQSVYGDVTKLVDHLPWVHKFISNAKRWIMGTHHGVRGKYLSLYLSEYTYRFNRRHDPNSLFTRGLSACILATPIRIPTLTG